MLYRQSILWRRYVGILQRNLALFLSSISVSEGCGGRRLTLAEVDQRVAGALPAGAGRARVLSILDSLKVEHSDFDEKTRMIVAVVPDSAKRGIVTRSFHFTFVFDSTGKLVSHTVKELFTGP